MSNSGYNSGNGWSGNLNGRGPRRNFERGPGQYGGSYQSSGPQRGSSFNGQRQPMQPSNNAQNQLNSENRFNSVSPNNNQGVSDSGQNTSAAVDWTTPIPGGTTLHTSAKTLDSTRPELDRLVDRLKGYRFENSPTQNRQDFKAQSHPINERGRDVGSYSSNVQTQNASNYQSTGNQSDGKVNPSSMPASNRTQSQLNPEKHLNSAPEKNNQPASGSGENTNDTDDWTKPIPHGNGGGGQVNVSSPMTFKSKFDANNSQTQIQQSGHVPTEYGCDDSMKTSKEQASTSITNSTSGANTSARTDDWTKAIPSGNEKDGQFRASTQPTIGTTNFNQQMRRDDRFSSKHGADTSKTESNFNLSAQPGNERTRDHGYVNNNNSTFQNQTRPQQSRNNYNNQSNPPNHFNTSLQPFNTEGGGRSYKPSSPWVSEPAVRGNNNWNGRGAPRGGGGHPGDCNPNVRPNTNASMPKSVAHEPLREQPMASGKEGRSVELLSNFYRINSTGIIVHHYDFKIEKVYPEFPSISNRPRPPPPKQPTRGLETFIKKMTPKILNECIANNPAIFQDVPFVHDGVCNLFSAKPLNLPSESLPPFPVNIDGKVTTFVVNLQTAAQINLNELNRFYSKNSQVANDFPTREIIMTVCTMVFRFIIEKQFTPYSGAYYDLTKRETSQGGDLKLFDFVPGFACSVRMTEFGIALNLHLMSTCMLSAKYSQLKPLLMDLFGTSRYGLRDLKLGQIKEASRLLRHLKITTMHTGKQQSFVVHSLLKETPYDKTFEKSDGSGPITIADYFKETYDRILEPYPLVKTTTPPMRNNPKCKETIVLPLEFCQLLPDQFLNDTKYTAAVKTELLRLSTHRPNEYFNIVTQRITQIANIDPSFLGEFGLELTTSPVKLFGRVLVLPKFERMLQDGGAFGGRSFYEPAEVPARWKVLSFDVTCQEWQVNKFIDTFRTQASSYGLNFAQPDYKAFSPSCTEDITNVLEQIKVDYSTQNGQFDFALIILPSSAPDNHGNQRQSQQRNQVNSTDVYTLMKLYADQELKIPNQCIKGEKVKQTPNLWDTLLQKVNGKLGGQNTVVNSQYVKDIVPMNETMVVGVDVNHPGPTEEVLSSVAAAVGSYDNTMSHYASSSRVQLKERVEIVNQIDEMMGELLEHYREQNNGSYPKNVIVFRDGVSEGQFKLVIEKELGKIQRALYAVDRAMKLSVVIVQKRHHTRFALTSPSAGRGRPSYNVEAGTVVDTVIVEPTIEGFTLNSHYSQLGTSKPTKYIVIHDDLHLTSDQLEKFCLYACHNCIRTRSTISHPTPVRYADLAAYRGKVHINANKTITDPDGTSTINSGLSRLSEEEMKQHQRAIIEQLNGWIKVKEQGLYYA